jgi:hypothetical protein
MDIIKSHVVSVGSTVASAGSAVTSGIAGQPCITTSCTTCLRLLLFTEAAASVADGTRDAALDAARLSADAKDVAAFKAGTAHVRSFMSQHVTFPVGQV